MEKLSRMGSFRNKLVGPMTGIILVVLVLMLALEISAWVRPSAASEGDGEGELVVKVGSNASGLLVDSKGNPIGQIPGPLVENPGSNNTSAGPSVIRIPKLEPGDYSLVLRGLSQGESRFVIQALHEGKTAFTYVGTANVTPGTDWLVKLHVQVLDGLAQDIRVISSPDSSATPRDASAAGEGAGTSRLTAIKSALADGIDGASTYMQNQWITIGSMLFLALVLLVIWKKH